MSETASQLFPGFPELSFGDSSSIPSRRLTRFQALESESIHILRGAAAEFARPVMRYLIGKDFEAIGVHRDALDG